MFTSEFRIRSVREDGTKTIAYDCMGGYDQNIYASKTQALEAIEMHIIHWKERQEFYREHWLLKDFPVYEIEERLVTDWVTT